MAEIQQSRYDQLLRRVCALYGPGSKVNDALAELFPVIDVENRPLELDLLSQARPSWARGAITPSAGLAAGVQLFNPAESNAVVAVTAWGVTISTASSVRFGINNVPFTTAVAASSFRDSRLGVANRPIAQIRVQDGAPVSFQGWQMSVPANDTKIMQDNVGLVVLAPGTGLEVVNPVGDVGITVTFMWRERPAESGELQF